MKLADVELQVENFIGFEMLFLRSWWWAKTIFISIKTFYS